MKKKPASSIPIISLLTDFGLTDEYVGVMKGVLLRHCQSAQIIDLCHTVPPQDIVYASRMLAHSYAHFPEGTIHLVVVDPGVGTGRDILIVDSDGYLFIGPDNGVLTPALSSNGLLRCFRVTERTTRSSTFHGRDIMAPAAGKLAAGIPAASLGEEMSPQDCTTVPLAKPYICETSITGHVLAIDHFGNIATSISSDDLSQLIGKPLFSINDTIISGLCRTYDDVKKGELLALIDSRGYLEISVNCGNAAKMLSCLTGDTVSATVLK